MASIGRQAAWQKLFKSLVSRRNTLFEQTWLHLLCDCHKSLLPVSVTVSQPLHWAFRGTVHTHALPLHLTAISCVFSSRTRDPVSMFNSTQKLPRGDSLPPYKKHTVQYSSEACPHSSRRLKWAKGERLCPQCSCDNCFAVFNFLQPSDLHSAPHILTLESLEGEKQTALTAKLTSDHQKLSLLLSTIVKGSHTAPGGLFYISAETQLSSLLWTHLVTKMSTTE